VAVADPALLDQSCRSRINSLLFLSELSMMMMMMGGW
jgi:hypothetical protein